jgi:hypothetical protein
MQHLCVNLQTVFPYSMQILPPSTHGIDQYKEKKYG